MIHTYKHIRGVSLWAEIDIEPNDGGDVVFVLDRKSDYVDASLNPDDEWLIGFLDGLNVLRFNDYNNGFIVHRISGVMCETNGLSVMMCLLDYARSYFGIELERIVLPPSIANRYFNGVANLPSYFLGH